MNFHGKQIIGRERLSAESVETFSGVDPRSGEDLPGDFHEATISEIADAVTLAKSSFDVFRSTSPEQRAQFLEAIASETESLGDALLQRASAETGHPLDRCRMELVRSVGQARLFAAMLREGSWVDARIDQAEPDRQPMPKPDVRSMLLPVGPVAVFGASNFPIAISVLGADTISAFACGCPVIVKAHPAHPGTCELAAQAVQKAIEVCDLPGGIFSMIHGRSHAVGIGLVEHPDLAAAAFTGSLAGGRALFDVANARPTPIPFYAELGSVNPIFVLPGALESRAKEIAEGFVTSLTTGVGQFCTNPGLVFAQPSEAWEKFAKTAEESVARYLPQTMLHAGIHQAYTSGIAERKLITDLELRSESDTNADPNRAEAACYLFRTDSAGLADHPVLSEELFGPVSTLVDCEQIEDMEAFAETMDGSLTASVHGTEEDLQTHKNLLKILERKAGRLIFNGYPVGLEVVHSMHHGGPYPATCHSYFTSIGTRCILRFVRPVCFQNWPQSALPDELKDDNPLQIKRMVNGVFT